MAFSVEYSKAIHNIELNGDTIEFVRDTEHVGLTRSTDGNQPAILARIKAHRRAVGAVLM